MPQLTSEITITYLNDTHSLVALRDMMGEYKEMTFNVDHATLVKAYMEWQHGALIQNAMPMLDDGGREFFMTGLYDTEWDRIADEQNGFDPQEQTTDDEWDDEVPF